MDRGRAVGAASGGAAAPSAWRPPRGPLRRPRGGTATGCRRDALRGLQGRPPVPGVCPAASETLPVAGTAGGGRPPRRPLHGGRPPWPSPVEGDTAGGGCRPPAGGRPRRGAQGGRTPARCSTVWLAAHATAAGPRNPTTITARPVSRGSRPGRPGVAGRRGTRIDLRT